jgi:GT2 family glycosyltransferase
MNVSVVICAYTLDRWDSLVASVQSCDVQTLRPLEIIVVVDYNSELLERATMSFPGAVVIANRSVKGLSGARNTGVAISSGDAIAFLDDDAYAEPEWLERLTRPLSDSKVAGVGGWILPDWESGSAPWFPETFYWILGCSYAGLPKDSEAIRNPIGASMAIRRRVFVSVGGFTSGIGRVGSTPLGCEETELCIRYTEQFAGERFVLARSSVVHHLVPASRLTWKYFRTRCWAEGISKAAVSTLVGSGSGLSSERRHVVRALPLEIGRSVRMLARDPRSASRRIALMVMGTLIAAAGLLRGHVALRRRPIVIDREALEILMVALKDEAE